ncbi:MAG TPA: 50S ribosomal protein L35 [Myxococcota bacterium]|nr:50S ribosomal protein L35 [Myxococcota bacterium]
MPKMKSHKGAQKRIKRTATGKLMYQKRNKRHILTKKSSKRKRQLRNEGMLAPGDAKKVDQLIPYA